MRFNWDKILFTLILILSIGVFYSSNLKNNNRNISEVIVSIVPKTNYFISSDSVKKIVLKFIDKSKDSITVSLIEKEIDKNTYIEKSQVFKTVGQELIVNINQKEPIARLITKDSVFYLDRNSNFMALSKLQSVKVPIVFGFDSETDLEYLTKISLLIKEDSFLESNISQILINDNNISLKLRGYQTSVLIGEKIKLKNKIKNLKAFYIRANEENNLNSYKELNLQFDNQVVAVKK